MERDVNCIYSYARVNQLAVVVMEEYTAIKDCSVNFWHMRRGWMDGWIELNGVFAIQPERVE